MPEPSINKLTIYKLPNIDLNADVPGYKCVATGSWKHGGNNYPYSLFFHKNGPRAASWLAVFQPLNLQVSPRDLPRTMSSGFILLVRIGHSTFGITGGVGHIHLRTNFAIAHRFGLDLAQRILARPELRGLSQRDTSGVVNSLDRAFRKTYNPQGDINNLRRVLTHVRGTLAALNPLQATIGKSIQASDALTVNGSKNFDDIIKLLIGVNGLLDRGKDQLRIPQLEEIDGKAHKTLIGELEDALAQTLLNYRADETYSLFLDTEDIGYLPDRVVNYGLHYRRGRHLFETFDGVFQQVQSILATETLDQIKALKRIKLQVTLDDGSREVRPLWHFLCGDVTLKDSVYFLNNRHWYRVSEEFLEMMNRELDNVECLDPAKIGLKKWDRVKFRREADFNRAQKKFVVMDQQFVVFEQGPIEFCDLLKVSREVVYLVHVKPETGAALRALFAQGFVSAQLFAESQTFRSKIFSGDIQTTGRPLTARDLRALKSLKRRQRREIQIVYAIFDDKPTHYVPAGKRLTSEVLKGALTTFAKVDLLDRVSNLRAMGYEVAVCRIRPYPTSRKKSRNRASKRARLGTAKKRSYQPSVTP